MAQLDCMRTQQCPHPRHITEGHAYDTAVEASACSSVQSTACRVTIIDGTWCYSSCTGRCAVRAWWSGWLLGC